MANSSVRVFDDIESSIFQLSRRQFVNELYPRPAGAAVAMVLSGSLQAVNVVYKISGDVLTQFLPVSGDLIADLLNGPRALNITIPATWRFNIDTDSAPFVLRDTSVGQTFVYSNAVTSMQSIYNGVEFSTLRPLQPGEVTMELTNSVAPIGLDVFDLKRYAVIAATVGQPLFNGFVVPFGQTTNGTLFENSNVSPSTLSVSLDQAGALDDAALPSQSGVFGSPSSVVVSGINKLAQSAPVPLAGSVSSCCYQERLVSVFGSATR